MPEEDGFISNAYSKEHVYIQPKKTKYRPFEVFTAVAMKNAVLWDLAPCGSR
jgi:hypothetical protein